MRTIYVSTPVTSRQEKTIEEQMFCAYRRHRELEKLWKSQIGVGDAFETFYWVTNERMSNAEAMGRCVQAVMESDMLVMDNESGIEWMDSKGCWAELHIAFTYKKEVIYLSEIQK